MNTADATDESLMLAYCQGNYSAFESLYARHSRGLYRFIAWQAQRQDWVDEVAQETWISLHFARETYHTGAAFKTLLYQLAKNRLVDALRKHRTINTSDMLSGEHQTEEALLDHIAGANETSPEHDLTTQQQYTKLHHAIKQLPADQREVLVLYRFSELSVTEIAELIKAGEETVKSRLRYAMQKLKQMLEG